MVGGFGQSPHRAMEPPSGLLFLPLVGVNSCDVEAVEILLVEDSPGDVRLTQEALKIANCTTTSTLSRTVSRRLLSSVGKVSTPMHRVLI